MNRQTESKIIMEVRRTVQKVFYLITALMAALAHAARWGRARYTTTVHSCQTQGSISQYRS
jgi:hypothetical protein